MATAKRVKQEDSVTFQKVPTTTQYFQVVMTDGVEKRREPMSAPVTSTFVTTTHTPQPDRIVLEMSVEEATTLQVVRSRIGGCPGGRRGDLDSIGIALRSAGVPDACFHPDVVRDGVESGLTLADTRTLVSPLAGTQTSPAKDVAGGIDWTGYNRKGLGNT